MNKKDKFGNSLANKSSQNTLPYPKFRESMPSKLKSPYFNPTQKKVADYKLNDLGSRIDNLRNEIRMEINATTKGQWMSLNDFILFYWCKSKNTKLFWNNFISFF